MKISELIQKYNLAPDSYYTVSPYTNRSYDDDNAVFLEEKLLKSKWKAYIEPQYYGFSFGSPTPLVWLSVIDEFLDHVVEQCPNMRILQIKIKFGGLRCYIINVVPDIEEEIRQLEKVLFDKKLIY